MRCHSQFCDLHSLPEVLCCSSSEVAKTLVSKSCLVATKVSDLQQTCLYGCTHRPSGMWLVFSCTSQPVPGSPQPCSQRAPAFTTHTNVKGFPGSPYPTKLLQAGEATFVTAPACKQDSCPIAGLRNECEHFSSILSAPVFPRANCFGCGGVEAEYLLIRILSRWK